ncbi:MAG: MBL fold metallo-hydrolase [Clostridia bacterium]|nr:MBL fold metallo-hydrolase [Clostridia bacterium]
MSEKKRKISKGKLRAIIIAAVTAVIVISLVVTNLFVPVKYLSSYFVIRNKGAKEGIMRVRFVDVGYGDCTIIELPDGKNMLIDAGDGSSANQKRILKFLNKCDIDVIDYLVCTSVNAEHCGGLTEIMEYKKVKRIFMPYCKNVYVTDEYKNFVLSASVGKCDLVESQYGIGEVNDESGYFFTFLSPSVHTNPDSEYSGLVGNPTVTQKNNASAVLWLEYAGTSFLFTSDVTDSVLMKICDGYSVDKDRYAYNGGHVVSLESCNVLKVPNHGNKSSAYTHFYELTKPEAAVISVGKNGQDCPSQEALSNAINYTGEENLYRTDIHGTVTFEVTQDGYAVV